MLKINSNIARMILSKVDDSKSFVCSDGKILSNLEELVRELSKMDKNVFDFHVNNSKNDFSTWIYDCLGDIELAENLRETKNITSSLKVIRPRIVYLKKMSKGGN
jgi:hypothetical protein